MLKIVQISFYLLILISCAKSTSQQEAQKISPKKDSDALTLSVPLTADKWHSLKYNSIPHNVVSFDSGMDITVRKSASPLIYKFVKPIAVKKISIQGSIDQLISIPDATKQGESGFDDFNLRLGLVAIGSERLGWGQKLFVPEWVKKMFSLVPEDQGLDRIYFFNSVRSSSLLNKKRTHPLSKYIHEHYAWLMDKAGDFNYEHTLDSPKEVGALWVSSDGDDTGSNFVLKIKNINMFLKER